MLWAHKKKIGIEIKFEIIKEKKQTALHSCTAEIYEREISLSVSVSAGLVSIIL